MLPASPLSPPLQKRLRLPTLAAYGGDGHRYIIASNELLTAFLELEAMLRKLTR